MGRKTSLTLDLNDLPADQAKTLRGLLDNSNFMTLEVDLTNSPARDEFTYTVTVETDELHHTVRTADTTAPAALRPLLEELSRLARTQRK